LRLTTPKTNTKCINCKKIKFLFRRWVLAGKATVTTITSSFGGGMAGIMGCYIFFRGKMKVPYIVNSVFASLVSITGNKTIVGLLLRKVAVV